MKTLYTLLFIFFVSELCYSQLPPIDDDISKYSTSTQESIKFYDLRYDFFYSLRKIQEPSTVSIPYTSFQDVHLGYQKLPFILDADIQFPISIQGPSRFGLNTLQVIPRFKYRIFQNDPDYPYGTGDSSLPVRTPSAMPGIAYYWAPTNSWSLNSKKTNRLFDNLYFGLYLYHHSNGQDGPELDQDNIGEVNTYNGNFGEQLVFEYIIGGRIIPTVIDDIDGLLPKLPMDRANGTILTKITSSTKKEWYWRLSYESHPKIITNDTFDELDIYGKHRINFTLTHLIHRKFLAQVFDNGQWYGLRTEKENERFRHHLRFSYIVDGKYKRGNYLSPEKVPFLNLSRRLNLNYTFYYIPHFSRLFAFYGQAGYVGSDEYNIYFNNSYTNFRFGISFAFFDQPEHTPIVK